MSRQWTKSDQSNHESSGMAPQCIGAMKIAQNCHERSHARKRKGAHQTPERWLLTSPRLWLPAVENTTFYLRRIPSSAEKYDRFIFVVNTRGQRWRLGCLNANLPKGHTGLVGFLLIISNHISSGKSADDVHSKQNYHLLVVCCMTVSDIYHL